MTRWFAPGLVFLLSTVAIAQQPDLHPSAAAALGARLTSAQIEKGGPLVRPITATIRARYTAHENQRLECEHSAWRGHDCRRAEGRSAHPCR